MSINFEQDQQDAMSKTENIQSLADQVERLEACDRSIEEMEAKLKNLIIVAKSIAPIGLVFTCLSIVTGSIWGKPTWGTFWAWDARITSMLIMALFYLVFIIIHKFFDEDDKANKISSIIAVIGLINIPIIKYSVEWWSTLHQPASIKISGTSTIHSSM